MNCLKCGRETEGEQAFCSNCLADMEQHPVKPGTVILLPSQAAEPPRKAVRKKKPSPTPEEYIPILKKKILFYRIVTFILALAVCGMIYITSRVITELDLQRLLGQNYNSITDILDGESTEPSN